MLLTPMDALVTGGGVGYIAAQAELRQVSAKFGQQTCGQACAAPPSESRAARRSRIGCGALGAAVRALARRLRCCRKVAPPLLHDRPLRLRPDGAPPAAATMTAAAAPAVGKKDLACCRLLLGVCANACLRR